MNQLRPFTLLGLPARSIRIPGSLGVALSRQARVAAATSDKKELIVTLDNTKQFCVLRGNWLIRNSAVVAQNQQSVVAAAEGGTYRVDVGEGERFLYDPRKVVGTLGVVQSRLVYTESRFDILQLLTKRAWRQTAAVSRSSYEAVKRLLGRIPIRGGRPPLKLPELPELPAAVKTYWEKTKLVTARSWHKAAELSFEYTHPPKVEIKGPCSVLVRP